MKSFIVKCPAVCFDEVLTPILPAYFTFITQKLNIEWREFDKIQPSTTNGDEDEKPSETEEVIFQKILRDLTRVFSEIMLAIFNPKQALDRITAEALKDQDEHELDKNRPLIDFLLFAKREMTEPILNSLVSFLSWKDTMSVKRIVSVCFRIITLVHTNETFHPFLVDALLVSAIKNLNDSYFLECQTEMIALISFLYQHVRPLSQGVMQVMIRLPNMTVEKVQTFEQAFFKEKTDKKQKALMRNFLHEVTGKNVGSWFKNKVSILNLPEKLFINRGIMTNLQTENQETVGLLEFFEMNSQLK